ncbi:Rsph1 [Symbiodinium sp. KB8]|nr:Rsph1 [Symbiodinium sp. KB8]
MADYDDEEVGAPYEWQSLDVAAEEEAPTEKYIKAPGRATVTYPNKDTFTGSFNDNKDKHGQGVYTWSTEPGSNPWGPEAEEEGEEGAAAWPAERIVRYEGDYTEGKREGVGKISLPNGDKYHGQWRADKFHGEGTYFYANGDIYSGMWAEGKKSGEGAFVFAKDRSQLVGQWEDNAITAGQWLWKDGTSWHGSFKNNKPIGRGVFYFPNGNQQTGSYVEEGDPEDEETELKLVWRVEATLPATVAASELSRAPPASSAHK